MTLTEKLVLLTCGLGLAGCRSGPKNVVAAIPIATNDAVYVAEHAGLTERAAVHRLQVYWNGPSGEGGVARQGELVERAIQDHDFGIVLSPASAFALNSVIERAESKGIPVVILGPPLQVAPGPYLSYVSSDLDRTGELAARHIRLLTHDRDEVLIAGVDPALPGSQACARAFEVELKRLAPNVRVVSRLVGTFSGNQSEMAIGEALHEHPKITAIYALGLNDVRGASRAVQSQAMGKRIRIIGNSYSLDLTYGIRNESIDALVIPDMRAMGAQAVENIWLAREGKPVAAQTVFSPVLLTRENIDSEEVQQLLKLDWRR